jgi:thiol:disulfide interchange protein DsbD
MKSAAFVCIFLIFMSVLGLANEPVKFKIINTPIKTLAGQSVPVQIDVKLPAGFHLYADQLRLNNVEPTTYKLGQISIQPETSFYDKHSQKNRTGFYENGQIIFQIESPEDFIGAEQNVKFDLRYQICSEKICYLPKNETLTLTLTYSAIMVAKPESVSFFSNLEIEFSKNIYWSFILVFLAGVLTSFTPCIFPMIPITMSVLGHDPQKNTRSENFLKSILYVLGIAVTYSVLGVIAAMTGSLFGNALSNKYVLSGMVILFILMAFGMWGFFDLQMPTFIRHKFGSSRKSKGYFGIFVIGLFAGIVASPCVGPVLVTILSYVSTTQNAFLGFGLLFTYALGLGLIFILIGMFSQFLKLLPKSGAWMNSVKFLMGFLMICMAAYYLNFIVPFSKLFDSPFATSPVTIENSSKLTWIPYSEDQLKKSAAENRPVMIDFFAEWCGACHELKDKTFSNPEFEQLSAGFDLIVLDATEDKPEIQKILTKYNVKGLPTVIFLNRKGTVIKDLTFTQFLDWEKLKPKLLKALE